MAHTCSRKKKKDDCKLVDSPGCDGCGFKHFDEVVSYHRGNEVLEFLEKEFFKQVQDNRKGIGGRIALDEPLKKLLSERLRKWEILKPQELKRKVPIGKGEEEFTVKCDVALEVNGRYIFLEVKGAGDNTNDILSAITAAQCAKMVFKESLYYYIGVSASSRRQRNGITREYYTAPERATIRPYVRWAEEREFLKFYGIVEIEEVIKDIEERVFGKFRV